MNSEWEKSDPWQSQETDPWEQGRKGNQDSWKDKNGWDDGW